MPPTCSRRRAVQNASRAAFCGGPERLEPRTLLAADMPAPPMAVGMNLENVVDWSPAWTFTDAFKASRPWINHAFNATTWSTSWDDPATPLLALDADGNVARLASWRNAAGQTIQQRAGTLMFRGLGGGYAGGTYRAEWDGDGVVSFGFDARVTSSGRTAAGRNYADLLVTPTDDGMYLLIESTNPANPVRAFNVWMPDWQGRRFAGERWQPGASLSPFHPLFLERLAPFHTLRFMGMQETNSSGIRTWDDRRTASDIRQGSGPGGTASEPLVNGISVEYMVQLANDLDADPWFTMPYLADDAFVRNFATYVREHLEPGRKVYVEWANEVWNFGWGFDASHWIDAQKRLPENVGLDPDLAQWIIAGREARRDLDIWSGVFAGQAERLVRVAAGWAAVDWVTGQITEAMGGAFDAIAIAPYITPTDEQRAVYSAATTVDRVLADARTNVATSLAWTTAHERLAREWSARLGRPIHLVAYEGGPHLDGRGEPYQAAFYAATNDPRMGDIQRDYLKRLAAAGMDLYVDFQFTGQAGAAPWGDFAKLHRMDEPLATAHRYAAVVAAADGSLWDAAPPPPAVITVTVPDATAAEAGIDTGRIRLTRSGDVSRPVTVSYAVGGSATAGADYRALGGAITFAAGVTALQLLVTPLDDVLVEPPETVVVELLPGAGYVAGVTTRGVVTIASDDLPPPPTVEIASAATSEGDSGVRQLVFVVTLSAAAPTSVTISWATANGTAVAGRDYLAARGTVTFSPGQTRRTIAVGVLGDRLREGDERFTVALSAPRNARLLDATSRASGTIIDDDDGPRGAAFASLASASSTSGSRRRVR
ncbi:MAG: Calx-beta domain-containing protein [Planctomycetaceae bacterium]